MPQRIQRRRTKGWRLPPNTVIVSRPSKWGNPFRPGALLNFPYKEFAAPIGDWRVRDRAHAVELFKIYVRITSGYDMVRQELAGKDLCCWCPLVDAAGNAVPCHADILLSIANGDGR